MTFGKFHGLTLGEIAAVEPSYVAWLARAITRDPDLLDAARVVAAAASVEGSAAERPAAKRRTDGGPECHGAPAPGARLRA